MKIKKVAATIIALIFMSLILIFPENSTKGAVNGLLMCSNIVIPSLFPFGVCALFLYNSGLFSIFESKISKMSKFLFGINGKSFCIFIISFLGGYPIGAILIESLYSKGKLSKRNAENMLTYCVNAGPAFIILAIGNGIFSNIKIGVILFVSNFLASLFLGLFFKRKSIYEEITTKENRNIVITDTFVESTAQASKSILSVCSFVVLFSTLIGIISALPIEKNISNLFCGFLEITNACVIINKNIYLLAFLLGFGGLCIHFQILSVLKTLSPAYLKIFLSRIIHGFLCLINSFLLFKIFPVSIETILQNEINSKISSLSLPFSLALIFMCATFLLSIKNRGRNI